MERYAAEYDYVITNTNVIKTTIPRKPEWLKVKLPDAIKASRVAGMLNHLSLNTICSSGLCPNRGECWAAETATFMIGGNVCTRSCRFCNVATGRPSPPEKEEIARIVKAVTDLKLRHVVITSVDRDDLPDLGAAHWRDTVKTIKKYCPGVTIETLIPDFQGRMELADMVIDENPEVISHNLETVRRLTPEVRCRATYETSLAVLRHIAERGKNVVKSGIMLGLGETRDEILQTMDDLLEAGCRVITIGQYLQPSENHYPVKEYIHPDIFAEYGRIAIEKGFRHAESSPLVRSSYHAAKHVNK